MLGVSEAAGGKLGSHHTQKVSAIIPAHDVGTAVAATARACRAIPGVDLIVVVDDGSQDDTAQVARNAGAVVVRHSVPRGRASAVETGVKVAAMRDWADRPPRLLLLLDADLGDSAVEATGLVEAVMMRQADCAIAAPPRATARPTAAEALARRAIRRATGWRTSAPLSTARCLTREAVNAAMPFAAGWGVDMAITIDLVAQGFSVQEIPCSFAHMPSTSELTAARHPVAQYRDVALAVAERLVRRRALPPRQRFAAAAQQRVGKPYPRLPRVQAGPTAS